MNSVSPVVVVGGGPAGAMAALSLARAGVACSLLERNAEATDKVCGEFLSPEAIGRLDALGFPWGELEAVPIRRLRLESDGRASLVELPFEGRSVRRRLLDSWLLEQAARAGAHVALGVSGRRLQRQGDVFAIDNDEGACVAQVLVLATGKHAAGELHPRRGAPGKPVVGWKMDFRALGPRLREVLGDCLSLFFFAGGYGGIVRTAADVATVSVLLEADVLRANHGSPLAPLQAVAGKVPTLALLLAEAEPAWQRPLTIANLPYGYCDAGSVPGLFPVGDQFAVLPSFTGTGISFALATGALAAQAILTAPPSAASTVFAASARAMARVVLRRALPLHRWLRRPGFAHFAVNAAHWSPWAIAAVARRTRVPPSGKLSVAA